METSTEEKTCNQRIVEQLDGRIEDLTDIMVRMDQASEADDYATADEAQEELDQFALSLDTKTTMVVLLSWGGPSDQFEILVEKGEHEWELADTHATYRFSDWFDTATYRTDDEHIMAYLENMVERLSY